MACFNCDSANYTTCQDVLEHHRIQAWITRACVGPPPQCCTPPRRQLASLVQGERTELMVQSNACRVGAWAWTRQHWLRGEGCKTMRGGYLPYVHHLSELAGHSTADSVIRWVLNTLSHGSMYACSSLEEPMRPFPSLFNDKRVATVKAMSVYAPVQEGAWGGGGRWGLCRSSWRRLLAAQDHPVGAHYHRRGSDQLIDKPWVDRPCSRYDHIIDYVRAQMWGLPELHLAPWARPQGR